VGILIASTQPDGIQKLALDTGITSHITNLLSSPLSDYRMPVISSRFMTKALAGVIGLLVVYFACLGVKRLLTSRPALEREGA
jgi:hypothetical protein